MKQSTNSLNQAIERMTTGAKINHAKDNAANYNISTNMTTKLGALQVAEDNCAMGLDMLTTAEDSINQITDGLSRLRTLAVQAQNGTYGSQSLESINSEANALTSELNRIFKTASYNGKNLLDSYHVEIPEDVGCQVDLTPKYNGFIEDPVDYTDAEIALMNKMSEVDANNEITTGQYSISSLEEFIKFRDMANAGKISSGEFVLNTDIDLSSYSSGEGWVPISNFAGTFNGNGHVITNLYINRPSAGKQALFDSCNGGSVQNIGIVDCDITGGGRTGAITALYGDIINCYVTGKVKGTFCVGGLAGEAGEISNSWVDVDVIGSSYNIGGLAGERNFGAILSNCFSKGTVTGKDKVGGLVGNSNTYGIYDCYSSCVVKGENMVGGLVGKAWGRSFSLDKSSFSGVVHGENNVGGLIGTTDNKVSVWNSYTTATIYGREQTGGVIGYIASNQVLVSNTYMLGEISSSSDIAGKLIGGILVTKDGAACASIEFNNVKIIASDMDIVGSGYESNGGVLSILSDYDFSGLLNGVGLIYIPPEETTLQIGTNSGVSSSITLKTTVEYGLLDSLAGLRMEDASSLATIDSLLEKFSAKSMELGAAQNRLNSALNEISTQYENLVSSRSTLQDADIADISSEYIRQQILQQASATLLATANQSPSIALQLI